MHSIDELRALVESLTTEIRDLTEAPELTEDQDERLDAALVEYDEARTALAKAEQRQARIDEVRTFASHAVNVKPAVPESINVNTRTSNPFDVEELRGATPEKRSTEIRARAASIAESDRTHVLTDEQRADLADKVSHRGAVARDRAELVVQTGSAEYRDLFEGALATPGGYEYGELQKRYREINARTALATAGTIGALYVPYILDSTVILTNAGVVSPVRQLARNVTITGAQSWEAVTSAGVSAQVLGEAAAATDATPTFTSTNIPVWKQAAWALGSFESIADSGDVAGELSIMFADAKARLEGTKFTTGTGTSEPQGVVVFASNATSVFAGTSGDAVQIAASAIPAIVAADLYGMRASLSPRWRANASWMANLATAHTIRQLGTADNYHAFSLDITQPSSDLQLLGRPFYESSDMDATVVSGSTDFTVLHGDFNAGFAVVDRVGMTMLYEEMIYSGGKVPTGEAGWFVFWRSGSGGLVQDAFRLLKL